MPGTPFIFAPVVYEETPAADGVYTWNLPAGPISHLILTIGGLNNIDEADLDDLLGLVTDIEVNYKGSSIFNGDPLHLARLQTILFKNWAMTENNVADDNGVRAIDIIIPFSRHLFDPEECLPQRTAGDYILQVTVDIALTDIDGLKLWCVAVELPEANPTRWLKIYERRVTFSATGEQVVSMARGNDIVGYMIYGTTVPDTTAWTATVEWVDVLLNNLERMYSHAYWESLHSDLARRVSNTPEVVADSSFMNHYVYLDFDPTQDLMYAIPSRELTDLGLRFNAGVAELAKIYSVEVAAVDQLQP